MRIAIITTTNDPASVNIRKHILTNDFSAQEESIGCTPAYENKNLNCRLYTFDKDSTYLEDIDKKIDCELMIFATMHQSKSGIPVLSAHTAGNWGKAELGGKDRTMCNAPANYIKEALIRLSRVNTLGWDVVQEVTHHGPRISKPSLFIEIGSTLAQWENEEAGKILAEVILDLIENPPANHPSAVAVGGLHTMPNFMKIILNSDIAIGHACAKYDLENLDEEMLQQAVEKTTPKPSMLILDWKGLGSHKAKVKELAENTGLEVRRTKDF